MSLAEWDGLAPLAATIALVVLAIWPDPAPPVATTGSDWQHALEEAPTGQTIPWTDPGSGATGLLRPADVFRGGNGQLCRHYDISLADAGGRPYTSRHLACRLGAGGWHELTPATATGPGRSPDDQLAVAPM